MNKKRVLDSSKKNDSKVQKSFEELEDYVVGIRKQIKKQEDFLTPEGANNYGKKSGLNESSEILRN